MLPGFIAFAFIERMGVEDLLCILMGAVRDTELNQLGFISSSTAQST